MTEKIIIRNTTLEVMIDELAESDKLDAIHFRKLADKLCTKEKWQ